MKKRVLVVSDNVDLVNAFHTIIVAYKEVEVTYAYSYTNPNFLNNKNLLISAEPIHMNQQWQAIAVKYDLILSLHCKQLFPVELVKKVRCINVHPGFNPYNRGWFPQVFSILNNKKAGATIHEIDEQLDHGNIIARKEIEITACDTSLTAYNKIQQAEVELLKENIENILSGDYPTFAPEEEGNLNLKRDFNALCELNMEEEMTMGEAINRLRALTHGEYKNAWFTESKSGDKVFVSINLETKK